MKCKACKKLIEDDAVWCPECGVETGVIAERFAAITALKQDWAEGKRVRNYPFAIFFVLVILVPIALGAILTAHNYWLNNLTLLILTPLAFIPFALNSGETSGELTISGYFHAFRSYPKYFGFVLLSELYFFALKVICTGKPLFFFAADPILHLVRLVMVLYWIAIVLPMPVLMNRMGLLKAFHVAYKGGADTRWQQFFLAFLLTLLNLIAMIPVGLGLLITIPFTFYVIRRYIERLTEFSPFKRYLPLSPQK